MSKQSAKRIPPRSIDTIFGVSRHDLIPIVENAIQDSPVTSLEIWMENEILRSHEQQSPLT